jgi:hypothetical protein
MRRSTRCYCQTWHGEVVLHRAIWAGAGGSLHITWVPRAARPPSHCLRLSCRTIHPNLQASSLCQCFTSVPTYLTGARCPRCPTSKPGSGLCQPCHSGPTPSLPWPNFYTKRRDSPRYLTSSTFFRPLVLAGWEPSPHFPVTWTCTRLAAAALALPSVFRVHYPGLGPSIWTSRPERVTDPFPNTTSIFARPSGPLL